MPRGRGLGIFPDGKPRRKEPPAGEPQVSQRGDSPREIEQTARAFNEDHKLRAVIIEDKASGISAHQTLMASSEQWLSSILVAFQPSGDKDQRANQGAVWCRNGCVLIPHPSPEAPWLHDFETELFSFPGSAFKDQVDAFSQLIIYIENLLAEGWRARQNQGGNTL